MTILGSQALVRLQPGANLAAKPRQIGPFGSSATSAAADDAAAAAIKHLEAAAIKV